MLSLLRLERKQKNYSNPFRICLFLFLSYSFGIEAMNTFIHSVVPYKTISDSRLKWAKCLPVFRPKQRKKPYPMGRHIAIWLIYGSTPRVFVITSGQIQIGTRLALVTSRCFSCSHLLAPSSNYPPPKILGCKTQPEIISRAIKKTFIQKKMQRLMSEKKKRYK